MKIIASCVLILFAQDFPATSSLELPSPSAELFPYHAMVKGIFRCNGILISEDYVLTLASCINGSAQVTVYFDYRKNPMYSTSIGDPTMKVYVAQNIKIHQDFLRTDNNGNRYLNNIALIKLPQLIHERTAKLATKVEIEMALDENADANLTGWKASANTDLLVAAVRLSSQDTCRFLFGNEMFLNQEICIKMSHDSYPNWIGNSLSVNGKVIGLLTIKPECAVAVNKCSRTAVVLSIAPFLRWISQHTNIPIAYFTNINAKYNNKYNEDKIEKLYKLVEELRKAISKLQEGN
ncbi:unnamed protein product [Ceutorhynchus assimilis]|uniref:Peptidase S1 domain-containing protein n=1 Tax=Ceutorhynchus assimilis TaxID=467358 RepID=A0A9N9MR34_9CUCU|nr:unnamed protein product [Ceutorhynchus assimilis]